MSHLPEQVLCGKMHDDNGRTCSDDNDSNIDDLISRLPSILTIDAYSMIIIANNLCGKCIHSFQVHCIIHRLTPFNLVAIQNFRSDVERKTHSSFYVKVDDENQKFNGICCRFDTHSYFFSLCHCQLSIWWAANI